MLRLRKILLCDYVFYGILIVILGLTIFRINIKKNSKYDLNTKIIVGKIVAIDDRKKLIIKGDEKVVCYYQKDNVNFSINDLVLVEGLISDISSSRIPNTFNYKKYLKNNNIFWSFEASNITVIKKNRNIFYTLKNLLIKFIDSRKSRDYLKAFILGDTKEVDEQVMTSYRDLGISHLFAISGMHITLITTLLLKFLKKVKVNEGKRYLIVTIILFIYLFLTGIKASILRAVLFFLLLAFNKYYYFYIKTCNIFIVTLCLSLLYNPYYVYDVGFQFSFVISFFLIKYQNLFKKKRYVESLLLTSVVSFLASLPITINNFYQINVLSIFYNLLFVPLVSVVVFPLALVTLAVPFLDDVFMITINILESLALFFNNFNFSKLIIAKLQLVDVLIFYIVLFGALKLVDLRKWWGFAFVGVIVLCFYFRVPTKSKLIMIDVKQGDCILLVSKKKVALVDVGGIKSYSGVAKNYLLKQEILPFLKSLGIKKIDYLFLSHGDFDHIGNAYDLIKEFKVLKVYFNNGEFNYNEERLIELLMKKNVSYSRLKEGEKVSFGDFKLVQLNKYFSEENDNSMILYGNCREYSFLLMGDASLKSENYILSAYNLKKIDILKVGHHGSKTSSGKKFIETIKPEYSLISVGFNNKFNHPSASVIKTLEENNSIILETRYLGSVVFNLESRNQNLLKP